MKTKKRIAVPIYNFWLTIVVVDCEYLLTPCMDGLTKFEDDLSGAELYILPNTSPGVIAHECGHVKNAIFQRIGYTLDAENDEPEQYLLSYLVDEVYKVLKLHEKKKEKETFQPLSNQVAKKLDEKLKETHEAAEKLWKTINRSYLY